MLRTFFRYAVALGLFLACFLAGVWAGFFLAGPIIGHTRFSLEKRLVFNQDLGAGEEVRFEVLSTAWLPEATPPSLPWWRRECLLGRRLLGPVRAGTLVASSIVEGGPACLATAQADEWTRD